jgi:hypothetical protein
VDARQSQRLRATGTLMSLLRSPDFRAALQHPDDVLAHEVIVALHDDSLQYVCGRVHAAGGAAVVAVDLAPENDHFRLVTMEVSDRPKPREPAADDLGPIDGGSPISLALEYMDQARLKTMSWRLTCPDLTLEVVDSGDVPACA